MRLRTSFAFLVCGGTILTGCDVDGRPGEAASSEHVAETAAPIKGGYSDTTDTAVVGIVDDLGGGAVGLCSGSLLAPNMVLTARHCVSDTLNEVQGGIDCSKTKPGPLHPAGHFYVTTKPTFPQNPTGYHAVSEVLGVPSSDGLFCGNDQAILILAENLDPSEAVPMIPRVDTVLDKGEIYNAVGFGATDDAGTGTGTRRRRDNLVVNCAEDQCKGVGAFVKVTEWIGDTGICEGDSGGPALDLQNRVVGVTSRGGPGCTEPIYGAVHGWSQWIMDSAVHAAEVGGYDPPPWATGYPTDPVYSYPIGGECNSDAQPDVCISDVCLSNECTRLCSDAAVCPTGYDCVPINDTQEACQKHPVKKKPVVTETSCSMSSAEKDPTNPVPWFWSGAFVVGLGARTLRRRRRNR